MNKLFYLVFAVFYGFAVFFMIGLVGTMFNLNVVPLCVTGFLLWVVWNIGSMNKNFSKWEKFIKKRMSETKKAIRNFFEFITKEPKKGT